MTGSSRVAVIFGAGNIGRGFLAQLVHESGLKIIFIDVVPATITLLQSQLSYTIHIVGDEPSDVEITNYSVLDGRDRVGIVDAILRAEILFTAVGAAALPHIAPYIAFGIDARSGGNRQPLNIIICENLANVESHFRGLVRNRIQPGSSNYFEGSVGFVPAVVSRMAPLQTPDEASGLDLRVEAYHRLPVDAEAVKGELPKISGMDVVHNFPFLVARKLYVHNCGHAILGYLGWLAEIEYGWEALEFQDISQKLLMAWSEVGEALVRKFDADPIDLANYVQDLIHRFKNRALGDTCYRLAKDPVRKVAPGDRLVGAARLCLETGVEPVTISQGIAAAYRFAAPHDDSAAKLQSEINFLGFEGALLKYSGISTSEPLGVLVECVYSKLIQE